MIGGRMRFRWTRLRKSRSEKPCFQIDLTSAEKLEGAQQIAIMSGPALRNSMIGGGMLLGEIEKISI
jgi:hypothetical protein